MNLSYRSPFIIKNGHVETILPYHRKRHVPVPDFDRERLELVDGDFVDLDWLVSGNDRLLILSHGLEGSSHSLYNRDTAEIGRLQGWDILAWNCRSCSGEINRTARLYHHGEIGDIDVVVRHVAQLQRYQSIVLIGFSMGGAINLKYAGLTLAGNHHSINGVVAISTPLDLASSAALLDKPQNAFYRRYFLKQLKEKIQLKADVLPRYMVERVSSIRSWAEFDEMISAPMNAFRSKNELYQQGSAKFFAPHIDIPTLIINAWNDPMLDKPTYHTPYVTANKNIQYILTQHGGHCGFLQRTTLNSWAAEKAVDFANVVSGSFISKK